MKQTSKVAKPSSGRGRPGRSNQVRIIGGEHGGRKLHFPDLPGLRPTSDRTRETLFNWLQPMIQGARCLDLFAGSGVLGFEAISRGASRVVMFDSAPVVVKQLRQNIELLRLEGVEVDQADAMQRLEAPPSDPFDLVFLDPPFAEQELYRCCHKLQENGWLAEGARIYLEADAGSELPGVPPQWRQLKAKKAGQVTFFLYTV